MTHIYVISLTRNISMGPWLKDINITRHTALTSIVAVKWFEVLFKIRQCDVIGLLAQRLIVRRIQFFALVRQISILVEVIHTMTPHVIPTKNKTS